MAIRGLNADIVENWSLGVLTSIMMDRLPQGAVPYARNAQFYFTGPQTAIFGTRLGCAMENDEANTGFVTSQNYLALDEAQYHLMVDSNGSLKKLVDRAFVEIESGLVTKPLDPACWVNANQHALFVNGTDSFKTNGIESFKLGIDQPTADSFTVEVSGAGVNLEAGDYDVSIAYFNEDTGSTGPISDSQTVTVDANQKITVILPNATVIDDPQVTHIKVFVRQQATSTESYLVVAGTTPEIDDTKGWPVGTDVVDIDFTQDEYDVFVILAPGVEDNFPPPAGVRLLLNHRFRTFACDDNYLYWSDSGQSEQFNPTSNRFLVGHADGTPITGLASLGDAVAIFKAGETWALVGDDPRSWMIVPVDDTVGCTAQSTITGGDGKLFFMSLKGPQMWGSVNNQIQDITSPLVAPQFTDSAVRTDNLSRAVAICHNNQNYVAWAMAPEHKTRNSVIMPFEFQLNRWMSHGWDMVDVASSTVITDADGHDWPVVSDYDGNIFRLGVTTADGIPQGALAVGTLTSATSNTLTKTSAGWTADQLKGRYVVVYEDAIRDFKRYRITTNTTDTLTVAGTMGPVPAAGWHFHIGGIVFDWKTPFTNGGGPFYKKRIELLFLELGASALGTTVDVEVYKDMDGNTVIPGTARTLTLGSGDLWDVGEWDIARWARGGSTRKRIPIRTVGWNWQIRLLHLSRGEQVFVSRTGVQWQTKTKKLGF